jgi:hypothetical protein
MTLAPQQNLAPAMLFGIHPDQVQSDLPYQPDALPKRQQDQGLVALGG